jgi:hypothetical protein
VIEPSVRLLVPAAEVVRPPRGISEGTRWQPADESADFVERHHDGVGHGTEVTAEGLVLGLHHHTGPLAGVVGLIGGMIFGALIGIYAATR